MGDDDEKGGKGKGGECSPVAVGDLFTSDGTDVLEVVAVEGAPVVTLRDLRTGEERHEGALLAFEVTRLQRLVPEGG